MFGAARIVDRVARTQIVKTVRDAWMLAPRQQQRVDQPVAGDGRPFDAVELGVDEADIERGVVNYQRRIGDEFEKVLHHLGEQRLVGEEFAGKSVHRERFRRHVAFGVDMAVEGLARRHAIENLDAADLNQSIPAQRVEAGGFGVENYFAHELQTAQTNQDRRCGILAA